MIALMLFQVVAAATTPPPTRFELPNGLRVWVQEDHARPVALVQVTYKAGSLDEQPGATGIAHYVEHMVYRATKHIRNEDIYGYIDRIGGRYTGGTWPEFTRYAETVPSWALESALRVTADRMCCALFDSIEFERERSNVVTEANGFADTDPVSAFRDAVMYASFEVHPYRMNSNTWARDNLVLTRDEAFAWYRAYYGPNNAVLVIVGDVSTADTRRLVEKHFAALPRASASGEIRVVEPPQRVEKRILLTYPGVPKAMEIVYRAPNAAHPDYPTLAVIRRLLALRNMRDTSLRPARAVLSFADSASQYPYVFRISVKADSAADLEAILQQIQRRIDQLGVEGVSPDELDRARSLRAGSGASPAEGQGVSLPPRRSRLTYIADSLSDREALPWEVSPQLLERIRIASTKVGSQDIQSYVARWLRPSQRTVGFLVPGRDDFVPAWTDGRPLVAERIEVPPLTTPPAKRERPDPVPAQALRPLDPVSIPTARRVLANGIVLRAAQVPGLALSVQVRADSGAASESGGYVDLRRSMSVSAAPVELARLAREAAQRLPGSWTVAIVGQLTPAALLALGATAFAALPPRPAPAPKRRIESNGSGGRVVFDSTQTQVAIVARLPGVPRGHPDGRALELLNYIVGVPSYGGRLGWALTKSGLTYSSAARTTFGAATGSVWISTTCDTRNTPATLQAIREVVEGVGTTGVAEWELREAQAFMLGRTMLYGARDDSPPDPVATALLESELAGIELLDLPAFSSAYLRISLDEVNRVARKYYRSELLAIDVTGAVPRRIETQIFVPGTFRALFDR